MLKTQLKSYFTDRQIRGGELFLGLFYELFMDVLLGTLTSKRLQQATEIVRGYMKLLSYEMYRRQAVFYRPITCKTGFQQVFQAIEDLMVGYFAGDKLPFIKTFRVIQQCFNLGQNDALAKLIHIALVFLSNCSDDSVEGCFFLFRQEQSFVNGIPKEVIALDPFGQVTAP